MLQALPCDKQQSIICFHALLAGLRQDRHARFHRLVTGALLRRELRQVLTDILPGGSESPSTSTRTSTDRSKNSGDLSRKTVNATDGISERGRAADDGNQQTLTPEPADRLQNGGNGVGSAPHEEDDGRNRESFDKCPSPRDVLSSSGLGGKRVWLCFAPLVLQSIFSSRVPINLYLPSLLRTCCAGCAYSDYWSIKVMLLNFSSNALS